MSISNGFKVLRKNSGIFLRGDGPLGQPFSRRFYAGLHALHFPIMQLCIPRLHPAYSMPYLFSLREMVDWLTPSSSAILAEVFQRSLARAR